MSTAFTRSASGAVLTAGATGFFATVADLTAGLAAVLASAAGGATEVSAKAANALRSAKRPRMRFMDGSPENGAPRGRLTWSIAERGARAICLAARTVLLHSYTPAGK